MVANNTAHASKYRMSFIRLTENEYGVYDLDSDKYFRVLGTGPVLSVDEISPITSEDWRALDNDAMHDAIMAYMDGHCEQEEEDPKVCLLIDTDTVLISLLKMASILKSALDSATDRDDERVLVIEMANVSQCMRDYIEDLT